MTLPLDVILSEIESAKHLSEIIQLVNDFQHRAPFEDKLVFGCSANITIDQLEICLKKHTFLSKKNAQVVMGSFDSHIQNIELFKNNGVQYLILINLFDSIVDSFESRAALMDFHIIEQNEE